jgi:hypothetical protein
LVLHSNNDSTNNCSEDSSDNEWNTKNRFRGNMPCSFGRNDQSSSTTPESANATRNEEGSHHPPLALTLLMSIAIFRHFRHLSLEEDLTVRLEDERSVLV